MQKSIVIVSIAVSLLIVMTVSVSAQDEEAGPLIPAVASVIIPGAGQLLNGEVNKAILHFALDIANWTTWALLGSIPTPIPIGYLSAVAALGLRAYSGYDAYTVAKETGFSIGLSKDGIALSYHYQI